MFALVGSVGGAWAGAAGASRPVEFESQIRPLFERKCYECHGPEGGDSDLSLATRSRAFAPAESGISVIVPEASSLSLLIDVVSSDDPDERMPKDRAPLSPPEVELLRRWIDEGAVWPASADEPRRHWAYVPPRRKDDLHGPAAIDQFVRRRLDAVGLEPSPRASPETLLRRLFLDLTGLPPSIEEQDAFLADPSDQAWDVLVDRLLASPRFGEHWARPWLDVARHADSNGFQPDELRSTMWPYRDWVIEAINDDMPFDRFAVLQIAGDLVSGAGIDGLVATGFQRNAPLNLEAGIHAEQSRVEQVADRVDTTSTAFLATTVKCARCHDHKYDPVTQAEYYGLFAYFNNTPNEAEGRAKEGIIYRFGGPTVEIPLSAEKEQRRISIDRQLEDLSRRAMPTPAQVQSWIDEATVETATAVEWRVAPVLRFEAAGRESGEFLEDGSILISGAHPDSTSYEVEVEVPLPFTALKLELLSHESLPGGGPGRGDPGRPVVILSEMTASRLSATGEQALDLAGAIASTGDPGAAIDEKVDTGWTAGATPGQDQWAAFSVLEPIEPDRSESTMRLQVVLRQSAGLSRNIGRLRLLTTSEDALRVMIPPKIRDLLRAENRNKIENFQLRRFARSHLAGSELMRQVRDLDRERASLSPPVASVLRELDEPRPTYLLQRGNHLDPGPRVEPHTPAAVEPASPTDKSRLALARWIATEENPLFARVAVNRWWGELFGRPIVATPDDFGTRGERPTHPELLDWLAVELMENGWSRKHVLREIVRSETYRQTARWGNPEAAALDPENTLLWRSARPRLPAEVIRDQALSVSGLLSEDGGGPPVYPRQPEGVWNQVGRFQPVYATSKPPLAHRRSVYVVWRRGAPYPALTIFDAPDRTECTPQRRSTNTPLQALVLLNDPAYLETAKAFTERILRGGRETTDRIRFAFRSAVAREPTPEEIRAIAGMLSDERVQSPDVAPASLDIAPDLDPAEFTVWYPVAASILALDEMVTRS